MDAIVTPAPPGLARLLRLAWPIVVSRSTQVVVGLCDALMVAPLGEAALAATTTGATNVFTLLILPMGICFIVSSFVSQLIGRKDPVGARRFGFYGLLVGLAAQLLCLVALPLVPAALGALDYAPDVRALMTQYLVARFAAGGAVVATEALANFFGGLGDTQTPMRVNVLVMIVNVALNWVLIYGHLGAPPLGVQGAAIASSVATTLGFGVLLTLFLLRGRELEGARGPRLVPREMGRMLRFGLPAGLNWFFEFLAFSLFVNVVVAGLGTVALAGLMTVIQINSVAFMPSFGLASAGAILIGHSIGAGRKDDVPPWVRITLGAAVAWQAAVGLVYLAAPSLVFRPFTTADDAALLEVGVAMLMLSSAWQVFDASVNALAESLRAAGDTAFTLWARLAVGWLVFVPGSYVSVRVLGGGYAIAVLWLVAYLAILSVVLYLRYRSGAWRHIDLVGEPSLD